MATWGKNKTKEKQWFHTAGRVKISNFTAAGKQACYDDGAGFYGCFTPLWRLHGGYLIILFYNS